MSYQPQQGMGGPPPPPPVPGQYSPVPPAPAAVRRSPLRWIGVAVLVLGVAGGAVLYLLSGSTRDQTIEKFARAPVGCTTTLQFDRPGTFFVYVELTGSVTSAGGDCAGNGASYRWTGSTLPAYTLTMIDGDGTSVELTPSTAHAYDTGTWRGQTVSQVQVSSPGSYRLTVDSAESGFAVAVGGDPDADAVVMQTAGIAVAAVGAVLGLVLVVLGRRKGRTASAGVQVPPPPHQSVPAPLPPNQTPPSPPPPPGWGAPRP